MVAVCLKLRQQEFWLNLYLAILTLVLSLIQSFAIEVLSSEILEWACCHDVQICSDRWAACTMNSQS